MNEIDYAHIKIKSTLEQFKSWLTQYLWTDRLFQQKTHVELLNLQEELRLQYISPTHGLVWISIHLVDADTMELSLQAITFLDNERGEATTKPDTSELVAAHLNKLASAIRARWPTVMEEKDLLIPELKIFIEKFKIDYPEPSKCAFIMMQFMNSRLHEEIKTAIKSACLNHSIVALRADEKSYSDDLLPNVRTYLHGCGFGIAIFERLATENFNPNVSLEVGYMMALNKPVLLLKDSTLRNLPTDLVGRLYETFDVQNPLKSIPPVIDKWLRDKNLIITKYDRS